METSLNSITFDCPHCGQSHPAESSMVGELCDCLSCGAVIEIPYPVRKPLILPDPKTETRPSPLGDPAPIFALVCVGLIILGVIFFRISIDEKSNVPSSDTNFFSQPPNSTSSYGSYDGGEYEKRLQEPGDAAKQTFREIDAIMPGYLRSDDEDLIRAIIKTLEDEE